MKPFSLFNICPKCEKQSPGTEAFSAEWEPKLTSYYPREDKRNHSFTSIGPTQLSRYRLISSRFISAPQIA